MSEGPAPTIISGPRPPRPPLGLRDGGHVLLRCSCCNKPLADVHITQPGKLRPDGKPFVWKVRALCPYCGDKSYIRRIEGLWHPAGHGVPNPANPDDPDDNLVITSIANFLEEVDREGDTVILFDVRVQDSVR